MLHILLLILKMIGIILAVILGILVLLVCIAAFVPVRYEINARCSGDLRTLKLRGTAAWFFSLIRADIYYKENRLKWRLRIAWKKILGGQDYGTDIPFQEPLPEDGNMNNKKTEGEEDEDCWKEHDDDEKGGKETCGSESGQSKESKENDEKAWEEGFGGSKESKENDEEAWDEAGESKKSGKKIQETFGGDEEGYREILESLEKEYSEDEEGVSSECEACKERHDEDGGRIQRLFEKIKGIYRRIKCTIRNICDKIKELLEKKEKLVSFITDEAHAGAFRKVKKEVFKLLGRLRPKKFLLEVKFGFADPSLTGRLLAAVSPFYPYFGEYVFLKPDFTEKVLEGKLHMKGCICFCHFLALAWNLLWSKNVRKTYKDIKNFEI